MHRLWISLCAYSWAWYRDCESWCLHTIQYDAQTVILSICTQLSMMHSQYQHTVNHDAQTVSLSISTLSSMMESQYIHTLLSMAHVLSLFAISWTLCTNQVQFIICLFCVKQWWNTYWQRQVLPLNCVGTLTDMVLPLNCVRGTLTDIEAGAATELCRWNTYWHRGRCCHWTVSVEHLLT